MYYFVSDIHLGLYTRDIDKILENKFIEWLNSIENNCKEIYLLGDIFDYWFEYRSVIPRYFYRILATFERFTSKGIKIIYVMGNHDFGHRDFFLTELNIDIVKTDLSIEIENKKIYLSHGDEKIYNGREYSFLKKILRNNICQKLFCSIHPDIGIPIARASSRKSRKVQSNRSGNDSRYDCLKHFAEEKLLEGYDYVIMGHSHRSLVHTIEKPGGSFGTYINLGSWLDEIQYVFFDGTDFRLQRGGEAPAGN